MQDPSVVVSLVWILELSEYLFGFPVTIRPKAGELICKREPKQAQCKLMLRFDGQDIATDRLRLFWFVERAIEFRLRDGFCDPGCRNALNLIFHGLSSTLGFLWHRE